MSNRRIESGVILMGALLLSGCDKGSTSDNVPPLRTANALETPASSSLDRNSTALMDPSGTTERNFDGAIFRVPNAWRETPTKNNAMKVISADFRLPGAAGEARLTLSAAGGTVAENIDRWQRQFQRTPDDSAPKESTLSVAGKEATLVELFGTFRDGFSEAPPQPNSAMLGIVIPLKIAGRETNYFVKLTGPRDTVSEVREAFMKFVDTAKFKE